jgi:hypothetical protein
MRTPKFMTFYYSSRWESRRNVPVFFKGWSEGKLTYGLGLYFKKWCFSVTIHFYEKDKPVNPYWINQL